MTRIECTGSVRSVCQAEDSTAYSVVVVTAFPGRHPVCVRVELTLDDDHARAFAARYREDKAVRIVIEVDDVGGAA